MKFQRRILLPHSPTYLEMEEYITPSSSRQSVSITGSTSDLSEAGSVYCLSLPIKERSDSLNNLFNMSEDSTSLSNLSLASYSLSQHSYETSSFTNPSNYTTLSPIAINIQSTIVNNETEKISRKQYSSSYRSLTEEQSSPIITRKSQPITTTYSRRSGDLTRHYPFSSTNPSGSSSTTSSQKSFPIKTAETVLNTIGITKTSSNDDLTDKRGLITNDDDDDDDDDHGSSCENHYIDSSDEYDADMISSKQQISTNQTGRGLRKTVLNNVDRLLNSSNKQIKL